MAELASDPTLAWVPSPKTDTLADRLRLVRFDLGLTLEEIGKLCELPPQSWFNWENGRRPRDLADVVNKIHVATQVNRSWLMWGSASARMYATPLIALPSMRDNRYKSDKNSPLLSVVKDDE